MTDFVGIPQGQLTSAVRAKMQEHADKKGGEKLSPDLVAYFDADDKKEPSAG